MIEEIVALQQKRSHNEYAVGGAGAAPDTVAELEEALGAAEQAEMLTESLRHGEELSRARYVNPETVGEPPDVTEENIDILTALSAAQGGTLSAPAIAEATGLDKSDVRQELVLMSQGKLVARTEPSGDMWRITHFGEACASHGYGKGKKSKKRGRKKPQMDGLNEAQGSLTEAKQKFKKGDIVRRTGKAMKSMGLVSGPINGKVVGYSGRFPLIVWSDDPDGEPMAQAEAGLQIDKRAMARRRESISEAEGSYKAEGPLEKMIGEMVRGQSGKWLSKSQMKAMVRVLNKKGITKPSKDSYDDIAKIVGKTLAGLMKGEGIEVLGEAWYAARTRADENYAQGFMDGMSAAADGVTPRSSKSNRDYVAGLKDGAAHWEGDQPDRAYKLGLLKAYDGFHGQGNWVRPENSVRTIRESTEVLNEAKSIAVGDKKYRVVKKYPSKDHADGPFPKSFIRMIKKGGGAALLKSGSDYYFLAMAGGKPDGSPVWLKPAQSKRVMSYESIGFDAEPLSEAKAFKMRGETYRVLKSYSSKDEADGPFPKALVKLIGRNGGAALVELKAGSGFKAKGDMLVSKDSSRPRFFFLALKGGKPDGYPVGLKPAQYKRVMSY